MVSCKKRRKTWQRNSSGEAKLKNEERKQRGRGEKRIQQRKRNREKERGCAQESVNWDGWMGFLENEKRLYPAWIDTEWESNPLQPVRKLHGTEYSKALLALAWHPPPTLIVSIALRHSRSFPFSFFYLALLTLYIPNRSSSRCVLFWWCLISITIVKN